MGLWDELLLGAQYGEQDIPMRCLKGHAALAVTAGGFSVEGGFGEDDMGSTMLTPGHVRVFGCGRSKLGMVKHRCREDFGRRLVDTCPQVIT